MKRTMTGLLVFMLVIGLVAGAAVEAFVPPGQAKKQAQAEDVEAEKGFLPPGLQNKGIPPGLVDKGGLPPGLQGRDWLPPGIQMRFRHALEEIEREATLEIEGSQFINIPGEDEEDVVEEYTAVVKDEDGDEVTGEAITWSIVEAFDDEGNEVAITGVSIEVVANGEDDNGDSNVAELIVASDAEPAKVTVQAAATLDGEEVKGSLDVKLYKAEAASVAVSGPAYVSIPMSDGTYKTYFYEAEVLDQNDQAMEFEEVEWELEESVTGVSIDVSTEDEDIGVLEVRDSAETGTITVVATAFIDEEEYKGELEVEMYEAEVDEVIVSGPAFIVVKAENESVTKDYEAEVFDQKGKLMEDEEVKWRLEEDIKGITIDDDSGQLTVEGNAEGSKVTVVATSLTDDEIAGSLEVSIGWEFVVSDEQQLRDALANDNIDTIFLDDDIEVEGQLVIDREVTIDGQGNELNIDLTGTDEEVGILVTASNVVLDNLLLEVATENEDNYVNAYGIVVEEQDVFTVTDSDITVKSENGIIAAIVLRDLGILSLTDNIIRGPVYLNKVYLEDEDIVGNAFKNTSVAFIVEAISNPDSVEGVALALADNDFTELKLLSNNTGRVVIEFVDEVKFLIIREDDEEGYAYALIDDADPFKDPILYNQEDFEDSIADLFEEDEEEGEENNKDNGDNS